MNTHTYNQISSITKQYLEHRYSQTTEEKIQQWLVEENYTEEKERASLEYWNQMQTLPNAHTYKSLKRVNNKIGISKTIPILRRWTRVAAIIIPALFIVAGIYHLSRQGNTIKVIARHGETKHVVLPDNSEIWLNAGSTLVYPSEFKNEARPVTLEGEAWFSVQKDPAKPFIVNTNHLSVTVLGTEFNVKAYPREARTIATLATGKIEVKTITNKTRTLAPGEQLIYTNETSRIRVQKVSPADASSWKSGQLIFTDATFQEIIQTLQRHFNVTIHADKSIESSREQYTIKFLKNENIEQILNILRDVTIDFSYRIENKRIVIRSSTHPSTKK